MAIFYGNNSPNLFSVSNAGATDLDDEIYGWLASNANGNLGQDSDHDTMSAGGGDDLLFGGGGNDQLFGEGDNDILLGHQGNDILNGGSGVDVLIGGAGADQLNGGDYFEDLVTFTLDGNEISTLGDVISYHTSAAGISVIGSNFAGGDAQGDQISGSYFTLVGSQKDDTITNPLATAIYGLGGHDTLNGDGQDYFFWAGAGNDQVATGTGQDEDYGEEGNDTIKAGSGDDYASSGIGNDRLEGEAGDDILFGDAGADSLFGGSDSDFLVGGAGADKIDTGGYSFVPSTFKVDGLTFRTYGDVISYHTSTVGVTVKGSAVSGGDAQGDVITGPFYTFVGSSGGDKITDAACTFVFGLEGNDTISGGPFVGTMYGGDGNDMLTPGNGGDAAGGLGNDTITGILDGFGTTAIYDATDLGARVDLAIKVAQNTGTEGKDKLVNVRHLVGGSGDDSFSGSSADNTFYGLAGNDTLSGRDGNDTLNGSVGADVLNGGDGNDTVTYTSYGNPLVVDLADSSQNTEDAAADTLISIESLDGSGSTLSFYGNGADNVFDVFATSGLLRGRSGDDKLSGSYSSNGELYGDDGNDTISAGSNADLLDGGADNDQLSGSGGNDTVIGGAGNDTIDGGAGADLIKGGSGNDYAVVDSADDHIVESANNGNDTVETSLASFTLGSTAHSVNVENLTFYSFGTTPFIGRGTGIANNISVKFSFVSANMSLFGLGGNDTLTGGGGQDTLDGGTGADSMTGGSNSDVYLVDNLGDKVFELTGLFAGTTDQINASVSLIGAKHLADNIENGALLGSTALKLDGNDGANTLSGNSAVNVLNGSDGDDTLIGGLGGDTLAGGAGSDMFDYNATKDSGVGAAARDRITGFTVDADRIDLSTIDAIAGGTDDAFGFRGALAFTKAGQVRLVQSGADTVVEINLTGASVAEMTILLTGIKSATIDAGEFVL